MWNTFNTCKDILKNQYEENNWQDGLSPDTLKNKTDELLERYRDASLAKCKAELISFLLENAPLDIHPQEIFADKIHHCGIIQAFTHERVRLLKDTAAREAAEAAFPFEKQNVFKATMDFGHIAPDWEYVLRKGIPGIITDLEFLQTKALDKKQQEYYETTLTVYYSIKRCILRFAALAEKLNTEKSQFMADNLRQLTLSAPQTLAQAMQLTLLFYSFQMGFDTVIVRSLGGLDRLYNPFYQNDLQSGCFTRAQLEEITCYFLWKTSAIKAAANLPFYICGMDSCGNDATNEYTLLLLEQYRALDLYDPKLHVMYHKKMDARVLSLILTMIREGKNSFVFMNTPVISKALENIGIAKEDAKKVIIYGCYEAAAEGTEVPSTCGGMVNLAKAVELAIHNGFDPLSGTQLSPKTGEHFDTFEDFYAAVITQLTHYTTLCMDTIASYEPHYHTVCPSLIMSPTYRSSRESGIDLYSGGAVYNNTSIVGAGLATLIDSLIAVKKAVFDDKLLTLEELRTHLLSNWESSPSLRLRILSAYPKFGNNHSEADSLTLDIYNRFSSLINGRQNGRGGVFRCGIFSVDWRFWMGKNTGATPDGRKNGEPLSKNLAASLGQDKKGVTSYLNSLLKLDSTKVPDGYVADVALHHSAVRGEEGMHAFHTLLHTFLSLGGFAIHFNILTPQILREAQKEPEKYQNLQIRLCGWNVRFVDLSKAEQDEFIRQSENTL